MKTLLQILRNGAAALVSQPASLHTVYTGQAVAVKQPSWREFFQSAALHEAFALLLALLLAANSVFRHRFPQKFRCGPFLECGLGPLRTMQSGHPGDYVMWITVGRLFSASLFRCCSADLKFSSFGIAWPRCPYLVPTNEPCDSMLDTRVPGIKNYLYLNRLNNETHDPLVSTTEECR